MDTNSPSRFRSRFLREMTAQRENPFHSPPSSTGSHGTVSPTCSSISSGESTRRLNAEVNRVMAPPKFALNLDAAHRKWPEFYSAPDRKSSVPAAIGTDSLTHDANLDNDNTDQAGFTAVQRRLATERKLAAQRANVEALHVDKRHSDRLRQALACAAKALDVTVNDDSTRETWAGSNRTRAEMQPRVDTDTDVSLMLEREPAVRLSGFGEFEKNAWHRSSLGRSKSAQARSASDPKVSRALLGGINSMHLDNKYITPAKDQIKSLPTTSLLNSHNAASPAAVPAQFSSPVHNHNLTGNLTSLMMPDISHLGDFISGALKYNGNQNGVPVFVKNGRVHDKGAYKCASFHAEVDGLEIPAEEHDIFVSMDKIQEQIEGLQQLYDNEHLYALGLEEDLGKLQADLLDLKSGRTNDSGLGSASDAGHAANDQRLSTENARLEAQVKTLQQQLDEATAKVVSTEENTKMIQIERDRTIKRLQNACVEMSELADRLKAAEMKLEVKERELEASQKLNLDRMAQRQDITMTQRHDIEAVMTERCAIQSEVEALRYDNETIRKDHKRLMSDTQSLRAINRTLMKETEDLRVCLATASCELGASKEEIVILRSGMAKLEESRKTLRQDNDSLVRHNEKYFTENKILRRENSSHELSIHELHDENTAMKEDIEYLKQQLDHCRPIGKEHDLTAALSRVDADETEEGMTSPFFVPDITISGNEMTGAAEMTVQSDRGGLLETTAQSTRYRGATDPTLPDADQSRVATQSGQSDVQAETRRSDKRAASRATNNSQKVAFSLPAAEYTDSNGTPGRTASNVGSKRRSVSGSTPAPPRKPTKQMPMPTKQPQKMGGPTDDTAEKMSVEDTKQDVPAIRSKKEAKRDAARTREVTRTQSQDLTTWSIASHSHKCDTSKALNPTVPAQPKRLGSVPICPSLSPSARRVLDDLCEHSCNNCTVCTRITACHAPTTNLFSATEIAAGRKRVTIPRPIPVTEKTTASDATIRPVHPPSHALAMVIKSLQDEVTHINMRIASMQARYALLDVAIGKRERRELANGIKIGIMRAEVKGDQIYALNDVLLGLAEDVHMSEQEIEVTVFSITGASVRDLTGVLVWE